MMSQGDPQQLSISSVVPPDLFQLLEQQRDGAAKLLSILPERYSTEAVAGSTLKVGPDSPHNVWEQCGCYYKINGRPHEAIAILEGLYDHLLTHQMESGERAHKGAPLVWLSECHTQLNRLTIARRYLMLTACEDAIRHEGQMEAVVDGGFCFRAAWGHGLPHRLLERYLTDIWTIYQEHQEDARFPEWIIQRLDQGWMTLYPTFNETAEYRISRVYARRLLSKLGEGTGATLELLAHYLVSSMPGCRAYMRQRTHSTDLDVTGAFEGPVQDFRSDVGRYFVCECKDWNQPANVTAFAKFSRVLDSAKCRFGILFSREGMTGARVTENAEREQLKLFQDRGIVIVVVEKADLQQIADGGNFITMLREKYEQVRLDLRSTGAKIAAPS